MFEEIFGIRTESQFEKRALETFRFQYDRCPIYRKYCDLIGTEPGKVGSLEDIPFLPIRFFKQYSVISSADPSLQPQKVFTSSSTTGMNPSRHCVLDLSLYEESFLQGFRQFYGDPSDYVILALLPAYLEREGSSLVYMAERLVKETGRSESGFYLYDHEGLYNRLKTLLGRGQKTLLIGVAFALLDFGESYRLDPSESGGLTVMETGGMKGRKEELSREELHRRISSIFGVAHVHSEYGMCELLSQAYSSGNGLFRTPEWMRILVRGINDPFVSAGIGKRGVIHIADLANLYSCAFIETEDCGRLYEDGSFTIDGRISGAERRGCNMLIE